MKTFRVQKVTPQGDLIEETEVPAPSAEAAASMLVGGKLFRGQKGMRATLRAKVYSPEASGLTTLVRFYQREDEA